VRRQPAFALVGIVIVVVASAAALISHVLVDVFGDALLANDTYDHVAHQSRFVVFAMSATVVAGLLAASWRAAFADARHSTLAMREMPLRTARLCVHPLVTCAIVACALAALVAMEDFDVARIGGSDLSLQAALGGSFWLGIGVTTVVAALAASLAAAAIAAFARTYRTLVAVARDVLLAIRSVRQIEGALLERGRPRPRFIRLRTIVRRAAKRGPPPFLRSTSPCFFEAVYALRVVLYDALIERRIFVFAAMRRIVAALVLTAIAPIWPSLTDAAEATGSVLVHVASVDESPVPRARVVVERNGDRHTIETSPDGTATIAELHPGTYGVSATSSQYAPLAASPIDVRGGARTDVALVLARSATSLTTIGSVTSAGSASVSTSNAPTQSLPTQEYAARGFTRVSDVLADALSATVIRQGSGSPAAPESVALRGPDPTETLVDIDGHEINSGVSGDFDLSLLDPADFSNVQIVYGISPSALLGPSTIGGAINVRTLEPTAKPHGFLRTSFGTYEAFGETLQATGRADRLGYAFSLHQANAANQVTRMPITDAEGETEHVGSDVDGQTSLGKVRYSFGRGLDSYAEVTFRDQSVVRDLSAALTSIAKDGDYNPSIDSRLFGHNAGYGFDVQVPLGARGSDGAARTTALYRHLTAFAAQSVEGPARGMSTSYFDDRDRLADDTLEIDHAFTKGSLALKYRLRSEALDTFDPTLAGNVTEQGHRFRPLAGARAVGNVDVAVAPASTTVSGLSQTQRSVALRFQYDASEQFHYTVAAYDSHFSTFGHSFDPRFGVVWTPDARTSIRASAGTTFQAPQLTALYVPAILPQPDANGHITLGNAHLREDHATEYNLGFEKILGPSGHTVRFGADFYRTNLRTPSQRLLATTTCDAGEPSLACASYPINIGNAVYTGAELRAETRIAGASVRLGYGLSNTYPVNAPPAIQNGTIVPHEQFPGVPLHKATFEIDRRPAAGFTYDAAVLYEGRYNELNRPPFATLRASLGYTIGGLEFNVAGTNLTNVYATRFTQAGAGVPYGGSDGPVSTDAYALQGRAVTFSLARRF
jgi:outer membrane receptor protein involved in Fe transport